MTGSLAYLKWYRCRMCLLVTITSLMVPVRAQTAYPDQQYILAGGDSLLAQAAAISNLVLSTDGRGLQLDSGQTSGFIQLQTQNSGSPFNRGLPSWNGFAPDSGAGFKVYMRFKVGANWSAWLTVGYWKANLWSAYGTTSFSGGWVDIDYVKLNSYQTSWQSKVTFSRQNLTDPSPVLNRLAFFVSDTRTTDQTDFNAIVNDDPPAIFIPTTFYYQYGLDPDIGSRICSPTSTSMTLASYNISVDPVAFAWDTYDPYYDIFGVWPRAVQNASEYGLEGTVDRYRSWPEAYAVLAAGGRIVMSVGQPLYAGHLMMLAGFDVHGNPLVHDPARSNGYSYTYDKMDLSRAWFDKGGIAYTFYPRDTTTAGWAASWSSPAGVPAGISVCWNYPNPFNQSTRIAVKVPVSGLLTIDIFDLRGRHIRRLVHTHTEAGLQTFPWEGTDSRGARVGSGLYWYVIKLPDGRSLRHKLLLLK